MKLKYYLRGLGIGIILTSLILTIARNVNGGMSDKEIIKRAEALGMVMSTEDSLFDKPEGTSASEQETTTDKSENVTEESTTEDSTTEESTTEEPTTEEPATEEPTTEEPTTEETTTEVVTTEEATTAKTVVIKITKGMRCMEVADILYKEGIIKDTAAFNRYMSQHGYTQEILIGTYTLDSSMSFDEIADIIVRKF